MVPREYTGGLRLVGGVSYVAMAAEVLQELDLAQSALSEDFFAEYIGYFLDRDAFVRLIVHGGAISQESS
jgi:hypothetical protein